MRARTAGSRVIVLAVSAIAAIGLGLGLGNQVTRPIEDLTALVDKASKGLVEVQAPGGGEARGHWNLRSRDVGRGHFRRMRQIPS